METGTQLDSCHSGSRQPWRRPDEVHPVQYLRLKHIKKKIILTKNANLRFGDVELKRDLGSNESGRSCCLKNRSDVEER